MNLQFLGAPMSARHHGRLAMLFLLALQVAGLGAQAAPPAPAAAASAAPLVSNSSLDGQLLFELLVSEMALGQGDAGTAYEWTLNAARRTRDESLFRRATDIALQARAGEQALAATRAWRLHRPESMDALRLQLQILMLLNRPEALPEPLEALLALAPATDRPGLIAALPRFLQRANNPRLVAQLVEDGVRPYRDEPMTRVAARVAMGRAWMEAREPDKALLLAQDAHTQDLTAPGPALLALELMRERPAAEAIVQSYLRQGNAEPGLRMVYVRSLTAAQRYADAAVQLETATRLQPNEPGPFLSLGALHLELRQPQLGEAASGPGAGLADAGAGRRAARRLRRRRSLAGPHRRPASARWRCRPAAPRSWRARARWPMRASSCDGCPSASRRCARQADGRGRVLREVKRWGDAFEVLAAARSVSRRPRPHLRAGHGGREAGPAGRDGAPAAPRSSGSSPTTRTPTTRWAIRWPIAACACPRRANWCSVRWPCRPATPSSPTAWAGSSSAWATCPKPAPAAPGLRARPDPRSAPTWARCCGHWASATRRAGSGARQGPRRRQRRAARDAGPAARSSL
jgi:hypothetical protein